MADGGFITLEGGEGAGKSTQARKLRQFLESNGQTVLVTREPGGSEGAEEIRSLLVCGDGSRWSPLSELLLLYAARDDHLRKTIRPALDRGAWVICDRFADSTRAYQGYMGGVDMAVISELERNVIGDTWPDLTIIFDLDPQVGLDRATARGGGEDRFERMGLDFHQGLRQAFLTIAHSAPQRCSVVDAGGDEESVAAAIRRLVAAQLNRTE